MNLRLTSSVALSVMLIAGSAAVAQNSGGNAVGQAESAPVVAQDGLPTLEQIIKDAVDAIGGRDAVDGIKTLHTIMAAEVEGMALSIESKWGRNGGRWVKNENPMVTQEMGTDGSTAWMKTPGGGYTVIGDEEAGQLNMQTSLHMMVLDPKQFRRDMAVVEVAGREEFEGRAAHVIRFKPVDLPGEGFLYFDANTGRVLGLKQTEQSLMGQQTTTMIFEDWKRVSDVDFFHLVKIQSPMMPGGTMEMAFTALKVNELDESAFALPEEVEAIVAEGGADGNEPDLGNDEASDEIALEDLPESYRDRAQQMVTQIKAGGQQTIEQSLRQFEELMPSLPEGDDKLTLRYIVQELKKGQ